MGSGWGVPPCTSAEAVAPVEGHAGSSVRSDRDSGGWPSGRGRLTDSASRRSLADQTRVDDGPAAGPWHCLDIATIKCLD